jgi:hypothetical protein
MSCPKTNLRTLTPSDINRIYQAQLENGEWDFSDEREHMENLFCQRLNFLLVTYALIVAGLAETNSRSLFVGILISGTVIMLFMSLSIWRVCSKLLLMLAICYRIDHHPMEYVDRENQARSALFRAMPVNHVLGYWIPAACTLSLVGGLVCFYFGILVPNKP